MYVQDLFCGADPAYRLPVRIVNEYAWHNLFVRQLFIRPTPEELRTHQPEFTVIAAPDSTKNNPDFWKALDQELRPALNYVVTLGMWLDPVPPDAALGRVVDRVVVETANKAEQP